MSRRPAKRRYPTIEPTGDGWRAAGRIDGALHKGKVRATQLEAHDAPKGRKPKLHPHTMRHTFGSELARRGVSVSTVAALMAHSLAAAGANAITHLHI